MIFVQSMADRISARQYFVNRHTDSHRYHNSDMTTLGARLREMRKARGFTQVTLARASGVSQSVISDLERGNIHETTAIAKIAHELKVSAIWLDKNIGPANAADQPRFDAVREPIPHADDSTVSECRSATFPQSIIDAYMQLTPEGRELVKLQIEITMEHARRLFGTLETKRRA